jgi:hypothetical protein
MDGESSAGGAGKDGTYRKYAGWDTLPRSSVKLPDPSMAALAVRVIDMGEWVGVGEGIC